MDEIEQVAISDRAKQARENAIRTALRNNP